MRENYQAFTVGGQFIIAPPEQPAAPGNRRMLIMERGAFGSGEHETTRSCIELLESLPAGDNQQVLDLGSGTGILSIAALLLDSTRSAYCLDIDQRAVDSCRRNCLLNGVNSRVKHICGTLDQLEKGNFDLILANIYGDILLDIATELTARAKPGAFLLLSGILWEYNFDVKKKYRQLGCRLIETRLLDEFSTLLLCKE